MRFGLVSRLRRSALALPLAAVAALVILFINELAYRDSVASLDQLGTRGSARVELQMLRGALVDAETGERGYLLTGRKEYLDPYEKAAASVPASVERLRTYFAGDPEATALMQGIVTTVDQRLSDLATAVRLYDEGRHEAWHELLMSNIGLDKMERIRTLGQQLLDHESQLIRADRADVYETLRLQRIGVNAMTALSLLALMLFLRQTASFDEVQRRHALALQAEKDHLETEVARRTRDLTDLANYLQTAREDERSRLARELHDELGALLTAAKLDAARLKRSLGTMSPEAEARLKHLNDTINDGIGLKRRIIEDLRPSSLSNLGLVAALEIQAREFSQRSELPVQVELEDVPLADSAQITTFRLVQESLTNIAKYAAARRVTLTLALARDGDRARIAVRDDGRGFDPETVSGTAHGLMGMRYRVESQGGAMRVHSRPGEGTLIEAWLPLAAETATA
ncbi:CHASE3 domain-containing protein [Rubrivivax benzoatilyticus]|uniref:Oxygen sensor histidine kinase NreB n=1 Tax=Rubrivivax benzoatilyticus TaxID=316997 RepID=A0ABX0HXX0_9BURK|nr:CHASE3 domain-containing protein [Rubrivivax benzoatilyticus]EGJ12517.1 transmembrane sensor kinase vsrA transcription regulator protein [Rubrivivax benzoatilyticus JA2 = ATCC BAA-35]NHK98190.1 histidine kinase [Rubrivivax benzoatilyticus]NHL24035.1 histidine kinase [Rubrivivax benzoatilyticus]